MSLTQALQIRVLRRRLLKAQDEVEEWMALATHLELEKRGILPKGSPAQDDLLSRYSLVHYDAPKIPPIKVAKA